MMKQRVPLALHSSEVAPRASNAVVVVGSGLLLPALLHALRQRRIEPVCLCSLDEESAPPTDGIPVTTTAEAQASYPNATVLLLVEPRRFALARSKLLMQGWRSIYDCAYVLAAFEYDSRSVASGVGWLHFYLDTYFYDHFKIQYPNYLLLPSIDVVITERCSLKCRDCANLMQYYIEPINADFDRLLSALDLLMRCVDHILEFRLLGGEPFMNRSAGRYLTRLRAYDNYSRIAVFTNGTIVPSSETIQTLAHEDTLVRISDYGPLSRRLRPLTEMLEAAGAAYEVEAMPGWQPCGTIAKRNRTLEESTAVFHDCCAKTIFTLLGQRLYQCPFAAHVYNLGALPRSSIECVDLSRDIPREEVRQELFGMLNRRTAIAACDYCGGRRFGELTEPVAVQVSKPIPFARATEGSRGLRKERS